MPIAFSRPATRPLTPAVVGTVVWFGAVLAAGMAGVFRTPPDEPPVLIGLAAFLPPLVVVGLLVSSERFHAWARSLDLRYLTMLQTWRVAGIAFLALWVQGDLPGRFAVPAGLGDVAVGLTAPLVAAYVIGAGRGAKATFVGWTIFGIVDLLAAVALGVTASAEMVPASALPLVLIPAFGVPLTLCLHVISLAQLDRVEELSEPAR